MTVAVLKNRLLDLTDRTFKESDYGSGTFWEFVKGNKDILILDETTTPPVAILKGVSPDDHASAQSRIRPDLWRAVLDFSSGDMYFWDPGEKKTQVSWEGRASRCGLQTCARFSLGRLGQSWPQDDHDRQGTMAGAKVHQHCAGRSLAGAGAICEEAVRLGETDLAVYIRKARISEPFRRGAVYETSTVPMCGA